MAKSKSLRLKPNYGRIVLVILSVVGTYFLLITFLIEFEKTDPKGTITNYFDAIWYSLVTITTVGYGDFYPVTTPGRLIGYAFIFVSIGIYGFLIGQISSILTMIRENKKLGFDGTHFEEHAVIIGWNSYGRAVANQLVGVGKKIAVVTDSRNDVDLIREKYPSKLVYTLFADYNNFEFIKKTNIEKSIVVFINLNDDTEKLVYILNLKKYFNDLKFVVTLDNGDLKGTFNSAGVTYTISKHEISSKLLASYIFEPDVALYSEDIMSYPQSDEDFDIKEFKVTIDNPYLGFTYGEAFLDLKKSYNCVLIGLSKPREGGNKLLKNPEDNIKIELGDYLIMIMNAKAEKVLGKTFKITEGY